jgi:hypothetical protein
MDSTGEELLEPVEVTGLATDGVYGDELSPREDI